MSALAPLASDPALDQQGNLPLTQGTSLVPTQNQLSRNPMLPQHPLGAFTDSQYEADDALLRRQVAQQYADLLQQLGYVDENGQFIQGSVEAEANKASTEYQRQQQLAAEQVTKEAQNNGTLFSGIRGTLQGRAEDPFVRARADLLQATPLSLQQLYEHAAGLSGDYVLQQNQLLASAAARRASGIIDNPGALGGAGAGAGATAGASAAPISGVPIVPGFSTDASGNIITAIGPDGQPTATKPGGLFPPGTDLLSGPLPSAGPSVAPTLPPPIDPRLKPMPGQNIAV